MEGVTSGEPLEGREAKGGKRGEPQVLQKTSSSIGALVVLRRRDVLDSRARSRHQEVAKLPNF
jgi:hypothetical protein